MSATHSPIDQVTAISVTYHSRSLVPVMAETLQQFSHFAVVDNHSNDGTIEALTEALPHGRYIRNEKNTGFGAAINTALRHVETEFALLLNPDCKIAASDVEELLRAARDFKSALLLGPQIIDLDGTPQISYDWDFDPGQSARPYLTPEGPASVKWMSGCCILIRVEPFVAMGGFDERFFMYFEEYDVCRRAIANGMDCIVVPSAVARHKGNASSAPSLLTEHIKMRHYFRSKRLFLEKHGVISASEARRSAELAVFAFIVLLFALSFQGKRMRKWLAKAHSLF